MREKVVPIIVSGRGGGDRWPGESFVDVGNEVGVANEVKVVVEGGTTPGFSRVTLFYREVPGSKKF